MRQELDETSHKIEVVEDDQVDEWLKHNWLVICLTDPTTWPLLSEALKKHLTEEINILYGVAYCGKQEI